MSAIDVAIRYMDEMGKKKACSIVGVATRISSSDRQIKLCILLESRPRQNKIYSGD